MSIVISVVESTSFAARRTRSFAFLGPIRRARAMGHGDDPLTTKTRGEVWSFLKRLQKKLAHLPHGHAFIMSPLTLEDGGQPLFVHIGYAFSGGRGPLDHHGFESLPEDRAVSDGVSSGDPALLAGPADGCLTIQTSRPFRGIFHHRECFVRRIRELLVVEGLHPFILRSRFILSFG